MRWGVFLGWLLPFVVAGYFAGQAMDDLGLGLGIFGVLGGITGWVQSRR